jgi:hypothetical protein
MYSDALLLLSDQQHYQHNLKPCPVRTSGDKLCQQLLQ